MVQETEFRPLMVSILCTTYNHEPYISQCLDGFVMQKTNFRFEAIVHDDASTDGTAAIIREYAEKYPDIIKPIYETENQYSKHDGSLDRIMDKACEGKYIAFCEGDDYWTDSLKLQKQVNFLEGNPDYGMVYTGHRRYIQKENRFVDGKNVSQDFNDLLLSNNIATHTVVLQRSLFKDFNIEIIPIAVKRSWMMRDTPLWLFTMAHAKAKYLPDITGVYRQLENSACHFTSFEQDRDFWMSHFDMSLYFAKKYNAPIELQKKIALDENEFLISMAHSYNAHLRFPFYRHLKDNSLFTAKRYFSCKMRSTVLGRQLYVLMKKTPSFIINETSNV